MVICFVGNIALLIKLRKQEKVRELMTRSKIEESTARVTRQLMVFTTAFALTRAVRSVIYYVVAFGLSEYYHWSQREILYSVYSTIDNAYCIVLPTLQFMRHVEFKRKLRAFLSILACRS